MAEKVAKIVLPTVGVDGLIRIDGIVLGRFVPERGTLEVHDRDRMRAQCRGAFFVEVRLADLMGLAGKDTTDGAE